MLLDQVRSRGIPVRTIAAPAAWNQARPGFRVLHPPADWHPETSDNARSLVLDVEHAGRHLLLTGDLDQLGVVELAGHVPADPPIDLMLAPHHGGKSANPAMALRLGQAPDRHRQPADARLPEQPTPSRPLSEAGFPSCAPGNAGPSTFNGVRITSSRKGSWIITISLASDSWLWKNALTRVPSSRKRLPSS